MPPEQELLEHPGTPALAAAMAAVYARPMAFARHAMQEFVDKVDRGEARSRSSYARFKQALAEIDAAFPNLSPVETSPAAPATNGEVA